MTENELQTEILSLWRIVNRLEKTYKDKKFTIDGHLLGSIGEVYAKEKFKLELLPNSTEKHDAIDLITKELYQIKITQRNKIGLRSEPENLIVIKIENDGFPNVIYKGCGKEVWNLVKHKIGNQKFIYLKQLEKIKPTA